MDCVGTFLGTLKPGFWSHSSRWRSERGSQLSNQSWEDSLDEFSSEQESEHRQQLQVSHYWNLTTKGNNIYTGEKYKVGTHKRGPGEERLQYPSSSINFVVLRLTLIDLPEIQSRVNKAGTAMHN